MSIESLVLVANDKGGTISTLRVEEDRLVPVTVSEVGAGCSTFAVDATSPASASRVFSPPDSVPAG